MKQKYDIALTSQEWRLIIESLNRLRNRLIAEGQYTDAVDELLIKVVNAKVKNADCGDGGLEYGKAHFR